MEAVATVHREYNIPPKLLEVVDSSRIASNEVRLLGSAPEASPTAVQQAKDALLQAYLIHATRQTQGFRQGIMPDNQFSGDEMETHTFPIDRSLGLDGCTFFSWPFIPHAGHTGANVILVTSDLLLDDRCFVTPRDLFESAAAEEDEFGKKISGQSDEEYNDLALVYEDVYDGDYASFLANLENTQPIDEEDDYVHEKVVKQTLEHIQEQLHNVYFEQLVSGRVWLEYLARILAAKGVEALPLGEIKFFGKIAPGKIAAQTDKKEFTEIYLPHVRNVLR